jgi:hypothetical protein
MFALSLENCSHQASVRQGIAPRMAKMEVAILHFLIYD